MKQNKIYASPTADISGEEAEHMAFVREHAGECVVLLENDGMLPLKCAGKIALYGTGARRTIKGGTGSGDVNSRYVISVEQGLEEAGFQITTKSWLDRYDEACGLEKAEYLRWRKETAKKAEMPEIRLGMLFPMKMTAPVNITEADLEESYTDTALYVIARNSGEAADRHFAQGDYLLFQEELDQIRTLSGFYSNVAVVLNVGGVLDLTQMKQVEGMGAILLMGQLGNLGGSILSDVLLGKTVPSGKLTDTWAKDYMHYPSSATFSHNNQNLDEEYYEEGIYVGYRYFDSYHVQPEYAFGYGKSYTTFSIHTESVEEDAGQIHLRVSVQNTGDLYSGKEVVQVYYSAPESNVKKPYQELAAFGKTKELKPGEREQLDLSFEMKDMASYDESHSAWILEAGRYLIRVGNSSKDTVVVKELDIEETIITRKLHPLFQGKQRKMREALQNDRQEFLTVQDICHERCSTEELIAQLSVRELASLCVGSFRVKAQTDSVVGAASNSIPGAAGDTTELLQESRGIRRIIMADGPAGLRLQPHFKAKKDGTILPGGNIVGDFMTPFPDVSEEVCDYYQYCTAIPIEWSLAQSWNTDLVKQFGNIIGTEMERYHIDLWLAPALNIHRNPLCGRNFEYYSEDPLISGKMAAAMSTGVQSHAGKGVVVKHFAANNQEANRYFTNAHISERALREIYLKGFEIAIRESNPMAVMTSYNLLNGVHTANCADLLQTVLREEWQYEGTVMTDWYTSQHLHGLTGDHKAKYPISSSVGCIYAGNDLQMPGCEENLNDIIRAVERKETVDGYSISLGDLQFCAANVLKMILKMVS